MRVVEIMQNSVMMRLGEGELVARGEQQITCIRRGGAGVVVSTPVSPPMREALELYAD